MQQLVIAGEQSGTLTEVLVKIGQDYETKTDTTTKDLSTILEPVLLVIVWLGVLGVAFAVILPIYSLIGGFNQNWNTTTTTISSEVQIVPPVIDTIEPPTDPVVEKKVKQQLTVTNATLNVRDAPSTQKGKLLQKVYKWAIYEYIGTQNGWYNIVISDTVSGWVSGDYIKIIAPSEQ